MKKPNRDAIENWKRNDIQFARLIAELGAVGAFTADVMADLADAMKMDATKIAEVIGRADEEWEYVKDCIESKRYAGEDEIGVSVGVGVTDDDDDVNLDDLDEDEDLGEDDFEDEN